MYILLLIHIYSPKNGHQSLRFLTSKPQISDSDATHQYALETLALGLIGSHQGGLQRINMN